MNHDGAPIDDELLSAAVDGEVTSAVMARIEADVTARHRLEILEAASALLGEEPPPPDPVVTEQTIAAALAVLDRAPSRRRGRWLVAGSVLAAAAAAAVGLLVVRDRSPQEPPPAVAAAPAPTDGAGNRTEAGAALSADASEAGPPDLGSVNDERALRSVVAELATTGGDVDTAAAAAAEDIPGGAVCLSVARAADPDLGDPVAVARLSWRGTASVLLVFPLEDGATPTFTHRALVLALDDCRLLVRQTLDLG